MAKIDEFSAQNEGLPGQMSVWIIFLLRRILFEIRITLWILFYLKNKNNISLKRKKKRKEHTK